MANGGGSGEVPPAPTRPADTELGEQDATGKAGSGATAPKRNWLDKISARATLIKPVLESIALVLAGGWFLGQCTLGNFVPAAELSLETSRAPNPLNKSQERIFVRATFKQVRAMVDVYDASVTLATAAGATVAACDDFPPVERWRKSVYVTEGDVLSFTCSLAINAGECGTVTVTVKGQRMFHVITELHPPGNWGKSAWRAAAASCPEVKH